MVSTRRQSEISQNKLRQLTLSKTNKYDVHLSILKALQQKFEKLLNIKGMKTHFINKCRLILNDNVS
jgi:hypothetical protein